MKTLILVPSSGADRKLLGLTTTGRILNELSRGGIEDPVLVCPEGVSQDFLPDSEIPGGMKLRFESPESANWDSIAQGCGEGAVVIDGSAVFEAGSLPDLVRKSSSDSVRYLIAGQPAVGCGSGKQEREEDLNSAAVRPFDSGQVRSAKWLLLNGLRKPMLVDGIVGYYIMRPITLRLTQLISAVPITPNQVTIFCFILGVAGALSVAMASSIGWVQLGALLYFAGATIDCVDGEIARLKYLSSPIGAWLDTLSDDITTALFNLAMGIYVARTMDNSLFLVLAACGSTAFVFSESYVYYYLLRVYKSGDVLDFVWAFQDGNKEERSPGVTDYLLLLTKRDFFSAFLLVLAIFDLVILGSVIVSVALLCYMFIAVFDWLVRRKTGSS